MSTLDGIYDHLSAVHGGFYTNGDEDDSDDEGSDGGIVV